MKLSELVHYRNLLEKYKPGDMAPIVREQVGHVRHVVESHSVQFPILLNKLNQNYNEILSSFDSYSKTIDELQKSVTDLIDSIQPDYFAKSYELYEEFLKQDSVDYVLNRRLSLTDEVVAYLHSRIKSYGDWHHAGMIIRPGLEDWIEDVVACDPLYLVDQDMEMLKPSMDRFNDEYKRRLRPHLIVAENSSVLERIPNNQIGFCLIYNFFNFKPFEIVKYYLQSLYEKLKPGGTCAFTFNNCDRVGAVELVERNFMCYTPGRLLMTLCESLGFEIHQTYQLDSACSWIEIRKPGNLTSLRGGQSLARIVAKSK